MPHLYGLGDCAVRFFIKKSLTPKPLHEKLKAVFVSIYQKGNARLSGQRKCHSIRTLGVPWGRYLHHIERPA